FEPRRAILDFRRLRWFGQLRDRTEDWDLPLRRRELAQLVAARDSELALLRADVEQLTGRRIGELDASSLAEIEYALRALLATTDTGGIRRVHRRVTLLVGSLYADALGGGEWSIETDPEDADFGEFTIARWSPVAAFRYFKAETPAGELAQNLTSAIESWQD